MAEKTSKHGLYKWNPGDEMRETITKIAENAQKIDDLLRFVGLGTDAIVYDGSIYVKNDHNIFGYDNAGEKSNLATVQQNNIIQIGDFKHVMWLAAKDYITVKAPAMSIVEEVTASGGNITPARTVFHQGNSTYHALMHTSGSATKSIPKNTYGKIDIVVNPISAFPEGSVKNQAYTIPRPGIYTFVITAKISSALSVDRSYLRFGVERNGSFIDLSDVLVSSAYGTPFISFNYMYQFDKGDTVAAAVKPLNEDLTIGAGSKFYIYFLGDAITK